MPYRCARFADDMIFPRLLNLLLAVCVAPIAAGAAGTAPENAPMPAQPAFASPPTSKIVFEAPVMSGVGPVLSATGGVLVVNGKQRMTAESADYNTLTSTGSLRGAVFTTCDKPNPDYRVEARELTLLPNMKIRARHVSLFLGRMKVLSLPSLKFSIGGTGRSSHIFPRPAYDKEDGFSLTQTLRLIDAERTQSVADLRLTTEGGVQGDFTTLYGFDGGLYNRPGRRFNYDALRVGAVSLPQEPAGDPRSIESLYPAGAATLYGAGVISLRQRTYDINNPGLIVYRRPELGMSYVGRQIGFGAKTIDPRLEMYPQVDVSWGRFREQPGPVNLTTRNTVGGVAAVNLINLGPRRSLQAIAQQNWSSYSSGDRYHVWSWAIDAACLFENGSFVSGRYILRDDQGTTPFEFDRLDIREEFQTASQLRFSNHVVGFVSSYNFATGKFYEYELMYGYNTDCLGAFIRWNSRIQRLSFDVSLINL